MRDKLKFIIALATSLGLVCGAPVSADAPQAGFKGSGSGSSGAPTDADYWVGTANGSLSAEVVPSGTGGILVTAATGVINADATVIAKIAQANNWSTAQLPSAFGTIDLGSTTRPWKDLYLGNGGSNYTLLRSGVLTGNRTVTFPDGNSTTVQPDTGAANNFITAISSAGVISKAQVNFTNLAGNATIAQGGTNNTALGVSALGIYNGDGSKIVQTTATANQSWRVNAAGTAVEAYTPSSGGSFTLSAKAGSFSASDGASYYYRNSATGTITLPASPADGSVRKFKQTSGTGTFAFNGAETINHADGTSDQSLTITAANGVIELIAVSGGWDET